MLGWANTYSCFLACVLAGLLSLPDFTHGHYVNKLSSTVLASIPDVPGSEEWSHVSCSHGLGSGSPALMPPGPALLFCQSAVQGLLSKLLHLARGRASYSFFMLLRSALPPSVDGKGWGPISHPWHHMAYKGGGEEALLLCHPQDKLTYAPANRVSFTMLVKGGSRPTLPIREGLWSPILTVFFMITGAMDINTNLGCNRTIDTDIAHGSSPGQDDTMSPRCSTGFSDLYDPGRGSAPDTNMVLVGGLDPWCLHGPWWQYIDISCGWTMDPSMILSNSLG